MPKKLINPEQKPETVVLHNKLNAILAILLRQLNDEALLKWNKQDKSNMVKMLIDLNFDNNDISQVISLTYGSVANIRSGYRKGKKGK